MFLSGYCFADLERQDLFICLVKMAVCDDSAVRVRAFVSCWCALSLFGREDTSGDMI